MKAFIRRCGQLLYKPICDGLPNHDSAYPNRLLWKIAAVAKTVVLEMAVHGKVLHGLRFGWDVYVRKQKSRRLRPLAGSVNCSGGNAKHYPGKPA